MLVDGDVRDGPEGLGLLQIDECVVAARQDRGDVVPQVLALTYLNRLSDLLFILARVANAGNDVRWVPGAGE